MLRCLVCVWLGLLSLTPGAWAAPKRFTLSPGPAQLSFRAYGFGMLPIDGSFGRFRGILVLDDAAPAFCQLELRADAASLQMPTESMTVDALGPDLLDVTRYPDFQFEGACEGDRLAGRLLLHGVSRPVAMAVVVGSRRWQATGSIQRTEWGMGARPLLAGPTVRISIVAGLPAGYGADR